MRINILRVFRILYDKETSYKVIATSTLSVFIDEIISFNK